MQKEQFIEIANKIAENRASEREMASFLFHINNYHLESSAWAEIDPHIKAAIKNTTSKNILSNIAHTKPNLVIKVPNKQLWPRWIAAAVIVIALGLSIIYYNTNPNFDNDALITQQVQDVAPGKQGATLKLSNGKTIRLTDVANGELAIESGVAIIKTEDGQLVYNIKAASKDLGSNTLSTANGETFMVKLPDGTKVWLNSASSLTYSTMLQQNGKRTVSLTGEGYFSVAKDEAHPFVVKNSGQSIEVLGTEFNVNAYTDEPVIATTLIEGSIKVAKKSTTQLLKPGEQALNDGNGILVKQVNVGESVAWKNGDFEFNEEKMSSIARKLERWYDVKIELSDALANEEFTGKIARDRNISRVLRMMEKTNSIYFIIEGRRIKAIAK
ncbi:MAG: FecR family protein [Pedobacter sp.]|nr:MAG: FecR family protein [Pedobacter sp.]